MYSFVLNMWVMGRYTEAQVNAAVGKRYITVEESQMILATPRQVGVN